MALKHKTLEELFAPIADAIRGQTGASGDVIADDFPDVLRELFARLGKDVLTLATDIAGMPYATVADLKAAVASAVAAIGPNATWAQVQYYIINNAVADVETAQGDSDANYWWTLDTLPKLLLASYFVYGDASKLNALDGLNINKVNNAPMWLRKDINGTPFTSETEVKAALQRFVLIAKNNAYTAANIGSLAWTQVQYVLLGGLFITSVEWIKEDPENDYWWESGNPKPPGEKPNRIVARILRLASKLDENIAEETDVALLTGMLDHYAGELKFQDANGDTYTTSVGLQSKIEKIVNDIYTVLNWDLDYMTNDGMYAQMTWNEVQYYLITEEYATEESGAIPPYAWRPEYIPWPESTADIDPLYTEFLNQMSVYALSGSTTDINWFTLARINALNLRRNEDGVAFTAALLTQAKTRLKGVIANAMLDSAYWDGTKLNLTWYQVQYALISTAGDLVDPNTARAKDYSWAPAWAKAAYHTLLDEFLRAMETFAASDMGTAANDAINAVVDAYYNSGKLDIRVWANVNALVYPYEAVEVTGTFRTQVKIRVRNLVRVIKTNNISPYYDTATGKIRLTWYQLQYYSYNMNSITGTATSVVSPEDAYAYYLTLDSHDWAPAWVAVNLEEAGA